MAIRNFSINRIILLSIGAITSFLVLFSSIISADGEVQVKSGRNSIQADNSSAAYYELAYKNSIKESVTPFSGSFVVNGLDPAMVRLIKTKSGFYLKSGYMPAVIEFDIVLESGGYFKNTENKKSFSVKQRLVIGSRIEDRDGDYFPDQAELDSESDRRNFIDWFVSIAESQYYVMSYNWEPINRSCSGLLIFAYKEALKRHDTGWMKQYPYLVRKNIHDVVKFNYPDVPVIGKKLFRYREFAADDVLEACFSETSNANNLLNYNLGLAGRNKDVLKKGDVLFFNAADNVDMPYHSMVYTGEGDFLVYHTGPLPDNDEGEVRKVKFSDLTKHPDQKWHPAESNIHFLGYFRWNIIM